jgi:IS5 family transposase
MAIDAKYWSWIPDTGLIHSVHTTAAHEHDVTQDGRLLHGQETTIYGDSGYRGVQKRD